MLIAQPISMAEANAFYADHHRHSKPVRFHLFSIAVLDHFRLAGVATVMRPASQFVSGGSWVAEVARLCTDGTENACSFLYARCARAAFAMGYLSIQTYTLPEEGGASLRAAGWRLVSQTDGKSWNTDRRSRPDEAPVRKRLRWAKSNPETDKKSRRLLTIIPAASEPVNSGDL